MTTTGGDADRKVTAASYALLLLGTVGYALFMFAWFLHSAFLAAIIADLGLTSTQAGLVTGAVPLSYIPFALVSGVAIDRVGVRNAVGAGLLLVGAAQVARSGATGFASVLVPTFLLGVGGTGVAFSLPKLVSDRFPAERAGSMSSVYVVGVAAGTAAAFGLGRPVLGPLFGGWRPLFYWSGLGVAGFALCWFVASSLLGPRAARFSDADDERGFSVGSIRDDLSTVFSHSQLRFLVLIGTMRLFVNHGLQAWLVTVLEARGFAAGLAAGLTTLLVLGRIGGTLSIPPLSDRYNERRAAVVGCGVLGTVGTVGLLVSDGSLAATLVAVVLVGLSLGGLSPLVRAIPVELDGIGPRLTATANGLIFTVGEVGGFAGPFFVGGLRDGTGSFLPGLATLAVGSAVVVVAGYAMAEPSES